MKKSLIKLSITLSIIFVGIISVSFVDPGNKYFEIARNLDVFATLFKEVNTYYVDEVSPDDMIRSGIDAMLNSLDPYTDYIPEEEFDNFRMLTTGQYGGIGAMVGERNGFSTVIMPFMGYPAYKAGILIGDRVLKIDGKEINTGNSPEIGELLKGAVNTPITLTIKRFGIDTPFDVTMKREKITISNVPYYGMVNESVGYIRLSDFTPNAGKEVRHAVAELKKRGASSLILDLRGNPGGLLDEAINVSNVFIPRGSEVVATKGKLEEWNKTYRAYQDPVDIQIPLAVLVSGGSASAAEIVAGVIQDYDRGVLVGRKTFGKGLVQATRPLAYNSQLKITTAKYYIPSGRCIQAIDYAHRNADGSVARIPDSLKVAFKTSVGRVVYDGGGVDPDILVEQFEYAPVTLGLVNSNHTFDYATRYYFEHKSIGEAKKFRLSDQEFDDFAKWVSTQNFEYSTAMERSLESFVASAKKEKYYESIESEVEKLKVGLAENRKSDLMLFRNEIKEVLEEEIVSRYYFEAGIVEASFDQDPTIREAVGLLQSPREYGQLLQAPR